MPVESSFSVANVNPHKPQRSNVTDRRPDTSNPRFHQGSQGLPHNGHGCTDSRLLFAQRNPVNGSSHPYQCR